jgi:hypothetical protein
MKYRWHQAQLEATTNAWTLYDRLAPLVEEVRSAHPLLIKLIRSARMSCLLPWHFISNVVSSLTTRRQTITRKAKTTVLCFPVFPS